MATDNMMCTFAQTYDTPTQNGLSPFFATVSSDQRVKIWSTSTNALFAQLTEPQHLSVKYTALAHVTGTKQNVNSQSTRTSGVSATSGLVAAGTRKGAITIWQLQTKESSKLGGQTGVGHSGVVTGLAFTSDGTRLFSSSADGMVFVWDTDSGRPITSWQASKQAVHSLALSPNEKYLLTADTVIKLWDIQTQQTVASFTSHVEPVKILRWSPDSTLFASGAAGDRFVNIWPLPNAILSNESATSTSTTKVQQVIAPSHTLSLDTHPIAISFSHPLSVVSSKTSAQVAKKKSAKSVEIVSTTKLFHVGTVSASETASIWAFESMNTSSSKSTSGDDVETIALSDPDCALVVKDVTLTNKSVALVAGNAAASKLGAKNKNQSSLTRTASRVSTEGSVCSISLAVVSSAQAATSGCVATIVRTSRIQPRLQAVMYARVESISASSKPEFIESVIELAPMSELSGDSMRLLSTENMSLDASVALGANPEGSLIGKRKEVLGNVSNPTGSAAKAASMATITVKIGAKLDEAAEVSSAITSGNIGESVHTKRLRLLALTSDYTKALADRIVASDKYVKSTKQTKASEVAVSKAGSLETALTQALTARDDKLFEQCISVGSKGGKRNNAIHATVARLKPQHIVALISKCISKMQDNQNRGPLLMPWIRECLYTHTGFLLTVPALTEPLAALHRIVDQRLLSFKRLLGLQGRLDLIMSQVNRSTSGRQDGSSTSTAKLVYDEENDEEESKYSDDDELDSADVAQRWGRLGYEDDDEEDDDDDEEAGSYSEVDDDDDDGML